MVTDQYTEPCLPLLDNSNRCYQTMAATKVVQWGKHSPKQFPSFLLLTTCHSTYTMVSVTTAQERHTSSFQSMECVPCNSRGSGCTADNNGSCSVGEESDHTCWRQTPRDRPAPPLLTLCLAAVVHHTLLPSPSLVAVVQLQYHLVAVVQLQYHHVADCSTTVSGCCCQLVPS